MIKFKCYDCSGYNDPCVLSFSEGEDEPQECPLYKTMKSHWKKVDTDENA